MFCTVSVSSRINEMGGRGLAGAQSVELYLGAWCMAVIQYGFVPLSNVSHSDSVWLCDGVCGCVPSGSSLCPAQQLGRDQTGRSQVRERAASPHLRASTGHRYASYSNLVLLLLTCTCIQ